MATGHIVTMEKTGGKAVKFLFEEAFDEPEVEIDPNAPEAPCDRSNAELEQLLAEAQEAGRQQGLEEARASTEASVAAVIDSMTGEVATLLADSARNREDMMKEAGKVAHTIAMKLTPRLMKAHPLAEIERLTEECLRELIDEPRLVVRLHERMVDPMRARVDGLAAAAGFEGAIVLLGDDTMGPLDCRIEWANGGAERNVTAMVKTVENAVNRYLSAPAQEPAPANAQSEEA